jgi:peptidoglycan/LPS O-acetylase OafA/YrhL
LQLHCTAGCTPLAYRSITLNHSINPIQVTSRHIAALDGLRGIAVLIVMLYHFVNRIPAGTGSFPQDVVGRLLGSGWVGVELFFVLSGFLITGILCDTRNDGRYFSTFYARRLLRIFPPYYGLLILAFIALPFFIGERASTITVQSDKQGWFWLYGANWLFAKEGRFEKGGYLWSLSVEEQFYVLWPLIVACLSRTQLLRVCAIGCATIWIVRPVLIMLGVSSTAVYSMTLTHMDGLLLGGMLAIACRSGIRAQFSRALYWAAIPAAIGVVIVAIASGGHFVFYYPAVAAFGLTCTSLLSGALVCIAITPGQSSRVKSFFEHFCLRAFGEISYALYLVHVPVCAGLATFIFRDGAPPILGSSSIDAVAYVLVAVLVSWCIALSSWHFFERPILRLKVFFPYAGQKNEQTARKCEGASTVGINSVASPVVEDGVCEMSAEAST